MRVADAEMVRALRVMTVARGVDPRGFALLAFGGAGPLHAAAIAEELGMRRILVPRASGVLSALGLAAADRRVTRQHTVLLSGPGLTDAALAAARDDLLREARTILGTTGEQSRVACDMRYRGQSHELTVAAGAAMRADEVCDAFEAEHERRYGWREPSAGIEVVTVRVTAVEPGPRVDLAGDDAVIEPVRGPVVLHLPETTVLRAAGMGRSDRTGAGRWCWSAQR